MSPNLRRLTRDDMDAAARLHRIAFDDRLPWLAGLHTPDEDRGFFHDRVYMVCDVWGAFDDATLLGFIAFRQGWIDQLYIQPGSQRLGLGTSLLACAKAANDHLQLWTFQRNPAARQFYERHGFTVIRETDGQDNEEREPDVLYTWTREP